MCSRLYKKGSRFKCLIQFHCPFCNNRLPQSHLLTSCKQKSPRRWCTWLLTMWSWWGTGVGEWCSLQLCSSSQSWPDCLIWVSCSSAVWDLMESRHVSHPGNPFHYIFEITMTASLPRYFSSSSLMQSSMLHSWGTLGPLLQWCPVKLKILYFQVSTKVLSTHTVSMFWKPVTKCLITEVNLNYANLQWCWLLSLPQCCAKDIQPSLSSGHRVVKKPRASISDLLWANSPRGGSRAWWPREAAALWSAAATHPTSPFSNSHHWGINTWYANYFPVASVKTAGAKPIIHGIHDEGDHLMLCEWQWQVLRVAGTEITVTFKLLYSFLSKLYINVFQWLIQCTASRHRCW